MLIHTVFPAAPINLLKRFIEVLSPYDPHVSLEQVDWRAGKQDLT
jgi:hypothetical protein